MDGVVQPGAFVALRLPSDSHHIQQLFPNTVVNLGKYGTFRARDLLGRPYHCTYEICDEDDSALERLLQPFHAATTGASSNTSLRIVTSAELYAEIDEDALVENAGSSHLPMRSNQQIVDSPQTQAMTMAEIESWKASGSGSRKDLIAKILQSHSALDQKTAFALAKYTLRKTRKYIKRFTVLPLDVALLATWIFQEKEAAKIMDLRQEMLALIGSWSNVHCSGIDATPQHSPAPQDDSPILETRVPCGRWLVVDETAGLLTAYLAEKMGLLYASDSPASHDTLTVVHPLSQPNLSLFRYFHFDPFNPSSKHPLALGLKTLSWLQLLDPEADSAYTEPAQVSETELGTYKSSKRSAYFRKRRRWQRIKATVDETRQGGFDGLVVASAMKSTSVLHHLVPLLRGGAPVVVYSPTLEPITELADCYSTARRAAYISRDAPPSNGVSESNDHLSTSNSTHEPSDDFPVDPRLMLAPTIHSARAKHWQVLPGRTHPVMMARGGSDGYLFTGTRVLPAEGKVEARGLSKKKRRRNSPS